VGRDPDPEGNADRRHLIKLSKSLNSSPPGFFDSTKLRIMMESFFHIFQKLREIAGDMD